MHNHYINTIYTKRDEDIPEYLDVIFETNQGFFEVGYGHIKKVIDPTLDSFVKQDCIEELKTKYGQLEILDMRTTYDNDMYFLISNKFLLVLGFALSSSTENSINEFWIREDIYGSNKNELNDFYELDKIVLPK